MRRLLMLSLLLSGFSVQAAVVSIRVTGTLTEFYDSDSLLPFGSLVVGATQFTMLFDLDLSVPDYLDSDPVVGFYLGAVLQASLSANGNTVSRSGGHSFITNDSPTGTNEFYDGWEASTGSTPAGAVKFSVILGSNASTSSLLPLTSDELVIPFMSPDWVARAIAMFVLDERPDPDTSPRILAYAVASVDSIQVVPIPAALWLFGSALGLLGWMRRTAV